MAAIHDGWVGGEPPVWPLAKMEEAYRNYKAGVVLEAAMAASRAAADSSPDADAPTPPTVSPAAPTADVDDADERQARAGGMSAEAERYRDALIDAEEWGRLKTLGEAARHLYRTVEDVVRQCKPQVRGSLQRFKQWVAATTKKATDALVASLKNRWQRQDDPAAGYPRGRATARGAQQVNLDFGVWATTSMAAEVMNSPSPMSVAFRDAWLQLPDARARGAHVAAVYQTFAREADRIANTAALTVRHTSDEIEMLRRVSHSAAEHADRLLESRGVFRRDRARQVSIGYASPRAAARAAAQVEKEQETWKTSPMCEQLLASGDPAAIALHEAWLRLPGNKARGNHSAVAAAYQAVADAANHLGRQAGHASSNPNNADLAALRAVAEASARHARTLNATPNAAQRARDRQVAAAAARTATTPPPNRRPSAGL